MKQWKAAALAVVVLISLTGRIAIGAERNGLKCDLPDVVYGCRLQGIAEINRMDVIRLVDIRVIEVPPKYGNPDLIEYFVGIFAREGNGPQVIDFGGSENHVWRSDMIPRLAQVKIIGDAPVEVMYGFPYRKTIGPSGANLTLGALVGRQR